MNNVFYNINVHSYYSLLQATLSIDEIIQFAIVNQLPYVVLTDSNLSGAMEFYHKAKKNNLNPVIGLDFTINDQHYLLLAKSNLGYHNLIKIHSLQNLGILSDWSQYLTDIIVISKQACINHHPDWYSIDQVAYSVAKVVDPNELKLLAALKAIESDVLLDEVPLEQNYASFYTYQQALSIFSPAQIKLNQTIIEQCHWTISDKKVKLAKFSLPNNVSNKEYLQELCVAGLKTFLKTANAMDKRYVDRLFYELKVINEMGYNDYFLIVADFVNFAKRNGILIGPGRGSAAGSLVAYSLGITEVDPITNNLIFERFLNPGRSSLPDIDIDVMDTRRQEVIDYIFNKYGPECCSYIVTFQHIKAKMAIRDVGRILAVPLPIVDTISKALTFDNEQDLMTADKNAFLQTYYQQYPELFSIAQKLVGIPRQISTHAAGIIIADQPLYQYIPVQPGIDQWNLSEFTMDYLEDLGLFKIDILGLKNLSIINEVLSHIWMNKAIKVDLKQIDLNDQKIFKEIANAETIGIFQLESPGMRNTLRKIKPRSIEDISITSALFRPGPQAMINDYVKTRDGLLEPHYISEAVKPFLEPTLGFCIYQEQVMELIKGITNFSMAQADVFRRAISKKNEALFTQMRVDFVKAAVVNHYTDKEANRIFDFLLDFANYGFNHSHSLAYSYISYQMMYLKHYYPLEFILVLLKYGDSANTKNNLYIAEARKKGISIRNVSILHSNENFSIFNEGIIFGLSNIKGLGMEYAKRIIQAREKFKEQFNNWENIVTVLCRQTGINEKIIELLIKVGAFDEFGVDRNYLLINVKEVIDKANIIDPNTKQPIFTITLSNNFTPMSEKEKSDWEYKLLSYSFSNNQYGQLFKQYETEFKLHDLATELNKNNLQEQQNFLIKVVNSKKLTAKNNLKMCFIEFNCNDVDYSTACFSAEICEQLKPNTYVICQFKISTNGRFQIKKIVSILNV